MEGLYPSELFLLEQTSMTLAEVDNLKEENPERYYKYYLFLIEKKKAEMREIEKLKEEKAPTQGEPEVIRLMDELPEDFVSDIEKIPGENDHG